MEVRPLSSGSSGNCYLIEEDGARLLLEAGIRYKEIQRALGFRVAGLAGCLVSHEHGDHAKAIPNLVRAGVDVYASQGTLNAAGGAVAPSHRLIPVRAQEQFTVGPWTVLPFETEHDAAEPLGFLIAGGGSKLLYATDTAYLRYRFRGCTHILIECNNAADIMAENVDSGSLNRGLRRRIRHTHFSLDNVKDFLLASDLESVSQIWLLHLSDRNSDAERFKKEIQQTTGKEVYIA